MDLGLKDRVYVVTGATRGLGNAAARELVADGAKVVITGRDEKTVTEAAAALGPGAVGVPADNSDPEVAQRLVAAAREHFGRFNGILISVGGPAPGFVADNTDEQWRAAFDSVFLACSFWLADALHMIGRTDEARTLFERLVDLTNDVGLLAEEYDPVGDRQLGNFPQAFSHIGLVNTALALYGEDQAG
jgi:NAD(P)-dependent dehydrogenase (short-subunit alcohol dehydrogenase family)